MSFYGDGSNVSSQNYDSWQDYDYTHQTMTTALAEQEKRLRKEFDEKLQKETESLKARFDYILYNEQIRTSHMLHEAHRERKEKIRALTQQLECKNLASLMYVMCAERTKFKMEKLQLVEKYTNYINMLNDILAEGQDLILNLSRGYKTAARVDFEWKEKMKKIVDQFLKYICYSTGTPLEQNQFYFDYEQLSMIKSSTMENPKEDPIQEDPTEIIECIDGKWWEKMENPDVCQLFVGYGDMANWPPDRRRAIVQHLKTIKSAPRRWKEYAFHDMFLKSECPKASEVKEDYLARLPVEAKWDCQGVAYDSGHDTNIRRMTTTSMDVRGNMGSLLKLITSGSVCVPKSNLLAARDSIELTSKTRLARSRTARTEGKQGEVFSLSDRRTSMYEEKYEDIINSDDSETPKEEEPNKQDDSGMSDEDSRPFGKKGKGYGHTDSLEMIPKHVPELDHRINFEKVCPMPSCRRMHVDAFMQSLPKYMRTSPFTHFEQTFDGYETLTPEQIEVLKSRIHLKKQRHQKLELRSPTEEPTLEWEDSIPGIGVQTSRIDQGFDDKNIPPCTCEDETFGAELDSNGGAVTEVKDLLHTVKRHVDHVPKESLWDKNIEFNRFKVLGEKGSSKNIQDSEKVRRSLQDINAQFTATRLQEITTILKENPSLLDLFQAGMN